VQEAVIRIESKLPTTELAREQADVLAFVNKNRGGCDALCYDLANLVDAVGVGARAAFALHRQTVLETRWQLDDLSIPVGECKHVGLLLYKLVACKTPSNLCKLFVAFTVISHRKCLT
jgi:hypothetical protein